MVIKTLQTDVLVVGSGLAGTLFAMELAKKRRDTNILLLSKKEKAQSASYLAQGGIAAAQPGAAESMKKHLEDTLVAGAGKCNPKTASWFISKAPEAIRTLEQWGTTFDCEADGSRALALYFLSFLRLLYSIFPGYWKKRPPSLWKASETVYRKAVAL